MRRLKIMKDDVPMACVDDFGGAALHDRLRVYCQEQKIEMARLWVFPPNGVYMLYAVSMHLTDKDRWVEYNAKVVYLLKNLKEMMIMRLWQVDCVVCLRIWENQLS